MMTNKCCNLPNKNYLVNMTDAKTGQVIQVRLNESTYLQYKQLLQEIQDEKSHRSATIVFNKESNNYTQVQIKWNE